MTPKTKLIPRSGRGNRGSLRWELGPRLVGQLDSIAVDDNLTTGVFRDASGGPDGLIIRVERDEVALDASILTVQSFSVLDNVNVIVQPC